MGTFAPSDGPLRWKQRKVMAAYKSAVNSGTVPDERHKQNGGYHCSVEDLRIFGNYPDYSSTRFGDRPGDLTPYGETMCAADDISMNAADMALHYRRVKAVHDNRANDTRAKFINYINTWKGTGDATRFDFVDGSVGFATADHQSHRHGDSKRIYLDLHRNSAECWKAMRATVSVEIGESHATWLANEAAGREPGSGGTVGGGDEDLFCNAGDKDPVGVWVVHYLQSQINELGYRKADGQPLTVDGDYGVNTVAGLKWAVGSGATGNAHTWYTKNVIERKLREKDANEAAKAALAAYATDAELAVVRQKAAEATADANDAINRLTTHLTNHPSGGVDLPDFIDVSGRLIVQPPTG